MAVGTLILALQVSAATDQKNAEPDDAVRVPALAIPESSFLSGDTRAVLARAREAQKEPVPATKVCPSIEGANASQAAEIRKCQADAFHASSFYTRLRDRFPVVITPQEIGGVQTEVFTPLQGVARENRHRVLINLHGGGFLRGWHLFSDLEAIPIASLGRLKVISIDYREGPEYEFPAASEDVASVYSEILKTYRPKNIGIFGCSAGGLLTAEAVAWFEKEKLPLPGAVGMFSEGAGYWTEGDSGYVGQSIRKGSVIWASAHANPYFKSTDLDDPLAFPVRQATVLEKFPPSLLISGTRDAALSSVVYTHSVLASHGRDAELRVWEGLGHCFLYDADLPESHDAEAAVVKFFAIHLER